MIPSVFIDGFFCRFLVLIISEHDIHTFGKNLSWNIFWIWTVYLHLHMYDSSTA